MSSSSSKVMNSAEILQNISDAIVGVAKQASRSVVRVGVGRGSGTGVVWNKEGLIVTSNHVIERSRHIEVGFSDGKTYDAKVIGQDWESDLALLKIEGTASSSLEPMRLGDSDKVQVGQFVLAIANAFGDRPAATSGIVTSSGRPFGGRWGRRMLPTEGVIFTDARLTPGFSGGPLVDASGSMIGLNAAVVYSRGVAIPVNGTRSVVEKLSRDGKIRRGFLGVVLNEVEIPEDAAKSQGLGEQGVGLMVLSVSENSPAKKAGVAMGDVIVKLDNKPVESLLDLHSALTDELIGKQVSLSVLRAEKLTDVKVTPSDAVEQ